jgi:type IV pilus assembly protein PilM
MYNRATDAEVGLMYVNVAGLTNVAVTSGQHCLFTRAAAGGLDDMVQVLADRRGLTNEHAAQWISHVGLAQPVEAIEGDAAVVATARVVLEEGVHQLADTVRNSLNFYRMQDTAENVERALLTGPAVAIPGFTERLAEELKLPVEPAVVGFDDPDGLGAAEPGRLTVAAGLAVEDR